MQNFNLLLNANENSHTANFACKAKLTPQKLFKQTYWLGNIYTWNLVSTRVQMERVIRNARVTFSFRYLKLLLSILRIYFNDSSHISIDFYLFCGLRTNIFMFQGPSKSSSKDCCVVSQCKFHYFIIITKRNNLWYFSFESDFTLRQL